MFLTTDINDIEDPTTLKNGQIIDTIFTHAAEVASAGGRIIIWRKYINASPDHLSTFSTPENLGN